MNKSDLEAIKDVLIFIKALDIITTIKDDNYLLGSERNKIYSILYKIAADLKKVSKETKSKYKNVDWNILDKNLNSCKDNNDKFLSLIKGELKEKLYNALNDIYQKEMNQYLKNTKKGKN